MAVVTSKFNGIAWANIAKINGIAKASIAKINGLDNTAAVSVLKDTTPSTAPSNIGSAISIGDSSGEQWESSKWTASSSYTVTRLRFQIYKTGTGQDLTCYIYSSSGGNTGSLLATSTTTVSAASLGGAFADNDFDFSGYNVTSGSEYYAVLKAAGVSSSNRDILNMDNGAPGVPKIQKDADGTGTWTDYFATRNMYLRVYGY